MVFQSEQKISDIDVALYLTALNKAKFLNASSRLKINFTVISVFLPRFCRSFLQFCQLILQSFNFSSRSVLFKVENIIPRTKYYCSKTILNAEMRTFRFVVYQRRICTIFTQFVISFSSVSVSSRSQFHRQLYK